MTTQTPISEVLQKAIEKAIQNGWDDNPVSNNLWATWLIYNHDFAKALWGEEWPGTPRTTPIGNTTPPWKHHLQKMVVADDPIRYLEENI